MSVVELLSAHTLVSWPQRESQPITRDFPPPEVVDLAHQSAGGLYHGPALRVQVSGQIRQQLLCRGVGDREISSQGGQHSHLSSCSIQ